jgi:hypothetical protein
MPYPYDDLDIAGIVDGVDSGDETPGSTNVGYHATLHRTERAALNDVKAELGPNPKGGAPNVSDRIAIISNFASPNVGGFIVNNIYDQSQHAAPSANITGLSNGMMLVPFYTSQEFSIDQIGVHFSTAPGTSGNLKYGIYESDRATAWPDTLVWSHEDNISSGTTTGYKLKVVSPAFTFLTGRQYWLGVRTSNALVPAGVPLTSAFNLGIGNSATATSYVNHIRRTLTYTTAWPASFGNVLASELNATVPPSIRFRVSAVA